MATISQRRKKLRVGGIWHDSEDNKVEILAIKNGRVKFKVLETANFRDGKLCGDDRIEFLSMEDRWDTMPIERFIAKPTGFDCISETGQVRMRNY